MRDAAPERRRRMVASVMRLARTLAGALLAVSLAGPMSAVADQRDPRLEDLFAALSEVPDPEAALGIEAAIWRIWLDGGDSTLNELMGRGIVAMRANRFRDAAERFTDLILAAPMFAEAWNKRATVYYLMGRLEDSVRDIERTLALEPRHFGAISGMGLIFLQRGDEKGALDVFEKVLEIHPHARGAKLHVRRLRERLKGRRI
ncbi:MAG: tetratricopeptide repeat protein [Thiotrichales bacterium]|nr:tetratricopeptide repeat protein [Thiotrichales bacterium]